MLDHGAKTENMNSLTTIRITSYEKGMVEPVERPVEGSDSESFHSAFTSAAKGNPNIWTCPKQKHKTRTYMIKYEPRKNDSRPGTAVQPSDDRTKSDSRPSSKGSSKSSPTVPRRKSSLGKKRSATRKPSSTTLHRQSCQIFSSLDGVLALSRDFTPLPSVSSSTTATRHHSLIPEENSTSGAQAMTQMCEKLDARLAYTYSYSYSLDTSSTSSIPLRQPKLETQTDGNGNGNTETDVEPTRRASGSQNSHPERPPFSTVISWTSDATRRKEYEKIDRANSGLRGFVRKILPKCMLSKSSRRGFFTGECDGDSVRRFRMDVDEEKAAVKKEKRKARWGCFQ